MSKLISPAGTVHFCRKNLSQTNKIIVECLSQDTQSQKLHGNSTYNFTIESHRLFALRCARQMARTSNQSNICHFSTAVMIKLRLLPKASNSQSKLTNHVQQPLIYIYTGWNNVKHIILIRSRLNTFRFKL